MEIEILLGNRVRRASNQINRNDSAEEIENDFCICCRAQWIVKPFVFISFDNGILQFKLVYENWTRRPFCQPIIIKVTTTNTLSVYLSGNDFFFLSFYMCCAVFRKFISLNVVAQMNGHWIHMNETKIFVIIYTISMASSNESQHINHIVGNVIITRIVHS